MHSHSVTLWIATTAGLVLLFAVDYAQARRPHVVRLREAAIQSALYIGIAVVFGVVLLAVLGGHLATSYFAGYLIEKSLSVDNLFVFVIILRGFAVPAPNLQKALVLGIAGALIMRAAFIAAGAAAIQSFEVTYVVFGAFLLYTALRMLTADDAHTPDPMATPVVRLARRLVPIVSDHRGGALMVREHGRRAATPLMLAVVAILGADLLFALDSIPAIFGITGDAYLVFTTNAFALLGLRALYFLVAGLLDRLVHLDEGLAVILVMIAAKLILHYVHSRAPGVPEIPTWASLTFVLVTLAAVTVTSLLSGRDDRADAE